MNPLLSVLPLLAVVVVVVAVIGVAYTLFMRGNNADNSAAPAPTTSAPAKSNPAASTGTPGNQASNSPAPSASASSTSSGKIDKTATFTVYNGTTTKVSGLAKKANTGLQGDGFAKGQVSTGVPPGGRTSTTKIYYATADEKATAAAIQASLGVGTLKLSSSVAANGVVVVVGDDYNR